MKRKSLFRSFAMSALLSAVASLLIVAVVPGLAEDTGVADQAAEQATEATTQEATTQEAATEQGPADQAASSDNGSGNDTTWEEGETYEASTTPDSHGHVGSGTGTEEGSQADPGHSPNDNATEPREQSNGDGTGDDAADECTNERHQGADEPQGGANENPGPYDNTCDGRISQNGQGSDANGAGTPCAGCVGNADDKNPPGQVREFTGAKPNDMGYECDGNQGVGAHYGNGNPAHTGDCAGTTQEEPPCVDDTSTPEDECNPKPPCVDDTSTPQDECNPKPPCEDIMPDVPGRQCEPPKPPCVDDMTTPEDECNPKPPCVDVMPEVPGRQCELVEGGNQDKVTICHNAGGKKWVVITIDRSALPAHLAHGDKSPDANGNCDEDIPPVVDDKVTICHNAGDKWVVITISPNALPAHLAHGDKAPMADGSCDEETPPVVDDQVVICHKTAAGWTAISIPPSQLPEHLAHGDKAPMANGNCEPQVLPNVITNPPPDVLGDDLTGGGGGPGKVAGKILQRKPQGAALPFTGASIAAFLALALQLIGAGALLSRAKKRAVQ